MAKESLKKFGVGPEPHERRSELLPGVWQHMPGVITTNLQTLVNWGRKSSIWYMLFGTACRAVELVAGGAARYDMDKGSPRQSEVLAGTVTEKMAPRINPLSRWVTAMAGRIIRIVMVLVSSYPSMYSFRARLSFIQS